MIGVKIQKSNINLHLKDIFKKPLQCLYFCIRQLEFNIYNKTNYMHRKDLKFTKNYLIAHKVISISI